MRRGNNPAELEEEAMTRVEIIWASLEEVEEEAEKAVPDPGRLKRTGRLAGMWPDRGALF